MKRFSRRAKKSPLKKEDTKQGKSHGRHAKPDTRSWLHIDAHGISEDMEVAKHVIMRRAHLPARDLRLLDPVLSYPSTILGREHAIVVNLDHIKAIITAQEVFLQDADNPVVIPLVHDLRYRLPKTHSKGSPDGCGPSCDHTHHGSHDSRDDPSIDVTHSEVNSEPVKTHPDGPWRQNYTPFEATAELQLRRRPSKYGLPSWHGPNSLPFEFRALETCLESACFSLDREAKVLGEDAHTALNALTSRVSPRTLETVRQIKNQLVLITGRVQRVRDEIEQLLDDDGDMAEMYLTEKMRRQQYEDSSPPSPTSTASSLRTIFHGTSRGDPTATTITRIANYPEVTLEDTLKHRQETMQLNDQASPEFPDFGLGLHQSSPRQHKAHHSSSRDCMSPTRNEEHHKHGHGLKLQHPKVHQSKASPGKHPWEHPKLVSFHDDQANNNSPQSKTSSSISRETGSNGKSQDVEELEMLLEAYFVLVDGILQHVATVKEFVDDTEDFVKIRLDDHQNTLLKVNVVLTISCLVIGMFVMVTGVFGMNINISLFNQGTSQVFWNVVGFSSAASVVLSALIIGWCKYSNLI